MLLSDGCRVMPRDRPLVVMTRFPLNSGHPVLLNLCWPPLPVIGINVFSLYEIQFDPAHRDGYEV